MSRKNIILLSLILVVAGVGAIGIIELGSASPDVSGVEQVSGETETISFDGIIKPKKSADLGFQTGGKIDELPFLVGDSVKEGDKLASLDRQSAWAQYNQAVAVKNAAEFKLEELEKSLKEEKITLEKLRHSGSKDKKIQKAKIDGVEASIDAQEEIIKETQAGISIASANLSNTSIEAPFDGVITSQNAETGETIAPNMPIITLESKNSFEIDGYLSQVQLGKIKVGDKAEVKLVAFDDASILYAHVLSIDPAETIVNNTSAYRVILDFDGSTENVKSGLDANIKIVNN